MGIRHVLVRSGLPAAALLLAGCATAEPVTTAGPATTAATTEPPAAVQTLQTGSAEPSPTTTWSDDAPPATELTTGNGSTASPSSREPACPPSGLLVQPQGSDAAMGLRILTVSATNCGDTDVDLSGYPVAVLAGDGGPLTAEHGGEQVTDPGPVPVLLSPGDSAFTVVSWRLLVDTATAPITVESFDLTPLAGQEPVRVEAVVDIGTTGVWYVTAWQPDTEGWYGSSSPATAPLPS